MEVYIYIAACIFTTWFSFKITNMITYHWPRNIRIRVKHDNGDVTVYQMKHSEFRKLCEEKGFDYNKLIGSGSGG